MGSAGRRRPAGGPAARRGRAAGAARWPWPRGRSSTSDGPARRSPGRRPTGGRRSPPRSAGRRASRSPTSPGCPRPRSPAPRRSWCAAPLLGGWTRPTSRARRRCAARGRHGCGGAGSWCPGRAGRGAMRPPGRRRPAGGRRPPAGRGHRLRRTAVRQRSLADVRADAARGLARAVTDPVHWVGCARRCGLPPTPCRWSRPRPVPRRRPDAPRAGRPASRDGPRLRARRRRHLPRVLRHDPAGGRPGRVPPGSNGSPSAWSTPAGMPDLVDDLAYSPDFAAAARGALRGGRPDPLRRGHGRRRDHRGAPAGRQRGGLHPWRPAGAGAGRRAGHHPLGRRAGAVARPARRRGRRGRQRPHGPVPPARAGRRRCSPARGGGRRAGGVRRRRRVQGRAGRPLAPSVPGGQRPPRRLRAGLGGRERAGERGG